MNKIKVAILEGPKETLDFMGSDIEFTDALHAEIVFIAGDHEISPEYCGQTTKDESRHDPVRDYDLIREIKELRRSNPAAILVGLGKGASYVEVLTGSQMDQRTKLPEGEPIKLKVLRDGGQGSMFSPKAKMVVPGCGNYAYTENGAVLMCVDGNNKQTIPIIKLYGETRLTNKSLSIHIDPTKMDKDSIINKILKSFIYNYYNPKTNNGYKNNAYLKCLSMVGDASIWSCTSKKLELTRPMEQHACFGNMVKHALADYARGNNKEKVTWKIKVLKPEGWDERYGRCVTFFKPEDYVEYYDRLKQIYPFEYKIEECDKYYLITLDINASCMWHKIILTMMRYIYQYPMNYILYDALQLKKIHKDEDIMDLLTIVSKTLQDYIAESGEYMILPYSQYNSDKIAKPFNDKEFVDLTLECGKKDNYPRLNTIGDLYTTKTPTDFKYLEEFLPCTISWEVFTCTFVDRQSIYEHNINVFQKLKK